MQIAELSVRKYPIGPPLSDQASLLPASADPTGRAAILFFIHGYNNSHDAAKSAYDHFLASLQATAASPPAIPVYEFFWPGDEVNPIESALSFAAKIGVAQQAALLFCDFLEKVRGPGGGPIDVHFVAHSLGNRLLLELLTNAASLPAVIVRSVTLMAAAVPVDMVAYTNALYQACLVPVFSQVLHSRGDDVLHWAFPPGETAHGEGFLPTAVGRFGEPAGNWRASFPFDTFGHGDYWQKPGPPEKVLACLGIATARTTPSTTIAGRTTATRIVGA